MSIIESIDEPKMKFIRPMFAVDVMRWVRYCDKLEERMVKLEAEIELKADYIKRLEAEVEAEKKQALDACEYIDELEGYDNER